MVAICVYNQLDSSPLILPNDLQVPIGDNNFVASAVGYTIDSNLQGYCITKGKMYLTLLNAKIHLRKVL